MIVIQIRPTFIEIISCEKKNIWPFKMLTKSDPDVIQTKSTHSNNSEQKRHARKKPHRYNFIVSLKYVISFIYFFYE